MTQISVVCPECGCQRQMERAKIPPRPIHATCPRCGVRFPFVAHLESPVERESTFDPFPDSTYETELPSPPAPEPVPDPTDPADFVSHRFIFTGQAKEYFGIWIVNLLLKIVTGGVYSAWAKVRKRRYFYGNTLLGNSPFDYTADPLAIFKGWLLGAAIFIVYSVGSQVSPILGGLFGIAFYLAVPWLVVRSRIFSLRNSTYRNIRFTFQPDYREAYLVFAALPLLIPLTFGMIIPYLIYRQKKFLVEKSGYGNLNFSFLAAPGDFYRFFLKISLGLLLIVGLCAGVAITLGLTGGTAEIAALIPLVIFALIALYFFAVVYIQTGLANLTWNATFLGESWFTSSLRSRDMAWLYLSSAVAIVCSFGLMIPWAAIRLFHYRCERLELSAPEDLQVFAVQQAGVGAGGEEIGDIFGVDVGL